jgi:hypothetical protein
MKGGRRKLHNEELRNMYSSPTVYQNGKIKEVVMGRACSMHGGIRNVYYKVLIRKCEEKRPHRKLRH